MGQCCGKDVLLEKPKNSDHDAIGVERGSSRVVPMSVLPVDAEGIDAQIVKALNSEIMPFIKQHCSGIYEYAFHRFTSMAQETSLGLLCPKLPGVLLELLQAELASNLATAKKQRNTKAVMENFRASRIITHQRILKFFRQLLSVPYERVMDKGLLAKLASAEKNRANRSRDRRADGKQKVTVDPVLESERVLAGLLKAIGKPLALTQSLGEVELTDTILRCVIKHIRSVYTDNPPKILLDRLQRHLILCELLSTERAYVETLENLRRYRDRAVELTRLQRSNTSGGAADTVLQKSQVDDMFREVEQLYLLNTTFLKDVEDALAKWAPDGSSQIGKLLNDFSRPFRMYDSYCVGYTKMMRMAQAMTIRSAAFRQLCASQQFLLHMSLADAMIAPVQRVPRYCLLLRELLKYTPHDLPDRPAIAEALAAFKASTKAVDVKIRDQANRDRIRQLSTLFNPPRNLVAPARVLKREVSVTIFRCRGSFSADQQHFDPHAHKSSEALLLGSKMKLFLFSDVLLIGRWRRKQGHFVYAGEIDVDRLSIEADVEVPYDEVAAAANIAGEDERKRPAVSNQQIAVALPTTVKCIRIFGFSGSLWAVLNTAVSTRDIAESEDDGDSNNLTFDPHRDSSADIAQLATDITQLSTRRRKQMIFKSISHLSVTTSVAPTPATRTNSLLPISAAGTTEEDFKLGALHEGGTSDSIAPLMRRETNADAFFSLHSRASISSATAQTLSRRHFDGRTTLENSVIPAIREQEFAVAWQLLMKSIQIEVGANSNYVGKPLHVRVRLLGRIQDSAVAQTPMAGDAQRNLAAATEATDVAFVTYSLTPENNYTWDSLAVLYLGDIVAGDWGIDGPQLRVEIFDDSNIDRLSFGSPTRQRERTPVETLTLFVKDLPSKLTAEAYTQSIEQADSLPAQAEGESDDDEIREVVSKINESLKMDSAAVASSPKSAALRMRLQLQVSTHIPSYDLVLLSQ